MVRDSFHLEASSPDSAVKITQAETSFSILSLRREPAPYRSLLLPFIRANLRPPRSREFENQKGGSEIVCPSMVLEESQTNVVAPTTQEITTKAPAVTTTMPTEESKSEVRLSLSV